MIVSNYQAVASVTDILFWVALSKSSFYYKPSDRKRGAKPSMVTIKQDGTIVDNIVVIEEIKDVLSQEFCCYGYHNVTDELRGKHYIINDKKVYRLMDEQNLLLGKVIRTSGKRKFVQHRKIEATRPMEYLCLDIKYVWVAGESRNYYLLTVLDVYTRIAIEQIFQKNVRKIDVINVFRRINKKYGIKGVNIRNDNGSQFIANDVKQFLRAAEANQEFTHVATPEENSYIEAFHSIVQREVIDRFEFQGFYEAKSTLEAHRDWYNNRRRHAKLGMTPAKKWSEFFGRTFSFNSFEYLEREVIDQSVENPETKTYICLPTQTCDDESYKSISSIMSN
jgi:transposase InsO family protein